MDYYRDPVTTASWQLLQQLAKNYQFVLIGGWAVWLHTHQLKSKDIDLIVQFDQLEKLKTDFPLTKNDRLKKYEIIRAETHIDIYVPHYSRLGLPVNLIVSSAISLAGFRVPPPEILLILKQTAHSARAGSAKGQKDVLDIIGLLSLPNFNWDKYLSLIPPTYNQQLITILSSAASFPELNLNSHRLSRLKHSWLPHLI